MRDEVTSRTVQQYSSSFIIHRSSFRRVSVVRGLLTGCIIAVLFAAACGGGDGKSGGKVVARNPTDPRRVPTATVPAQLPTPIPALETGQSQRTSLPETYLVRAGDTLGSIARDLGVAADELTRANPGINPNSLRIGQELRIPRPSVTPAPTSAIRGPAASNAPAGGTPTVAGAATTRPPTSTAGAGGAGTAVRTATQTGATAAGTSTAGAGAAATYTVEAGDTGCAIARKLGVSLTALAQANGLSIDGLASLRIGQVLQVPARTGEGPGC
jgi:LysM repeat protein